MIKSIVEDFKKLETSDKKIREFGLFVGLIFLLIGALLLWKSKSSYLIFLGLGGFLAFGAFLFRPILRPLYKVWMGFALVMGFFMSKVILGILFFFVVTPISIIAKLTRTKFLTSETNADSYWKSRKDKPDKESYAKQY